MMNVSSFHLPLSSKQVLCFKHNSRNMKKSRGLIIKLQSVRNKQEMTEIGKIKQRKVDKEAAEVSTMHSLVFTENCSAILI